MFDHLTMTHVAKAHMQYTEVFDHKTATHVVIGIVSGGDAVFMFDRIIGKNETLSDVKGQLKVIVDAVPGIKVGGSGEVDINETDKKESDKMTIKFVGDVVFHETPTTFAAAVKLAQQLPAKIAQHPVPKTA
jgi:hypothetical protein